MYQDKYAKRLEEERKVNVYFLQMKNPKNDHYYFYVAASALLHDQFVAALEYNQIPDFAVVVARGEGFPDDDVKTKMKEHYGFDHEVYEHELANALRKTHQALN